MAYVPKKPSKPKTVEAYDSNAKTIKFEKDGTYPVADNVLQFNKNLKAGDVVTATVKEGVVTFIKVETAVQQAPTATSTPQVAIPASLVCTIAYMPGNCAVIRFSDAPHVAPFYNMHDTPPTMAWVKTSEAIQKRDLRQEGIINGAKVEISLENNVITAIKLAETSQTVSQSPVVTNTPVEVPQNAPKTASEASTVVVKASTVSETNRSIIAQVASKNAVELVNKMIEVNPELVVKDIYAELLKVGYNTMLEVIG